jgi:hypothetical protein
MSISPPALEGDPAEATLRLKHFVERELAGHPGRVFA